MSPTGPSGFRFLALCSAILVMLIPVACLWACAVMRDLLSETLDSVDVDAARRCVAAGDRLEVARCLGLAALTPAVEAALAKFSDALEDAEDRAAKPSGAEDSATERDRRAAARRLDAAAADLWDEVRAAGGAVP